MTFTNNGLPRHSHPTCVHTHGIQAQTAATVHSLRMSLLMLGAWKADAASASCTAHTIVMMLGVASQRLQEAQQTTTSIELRRVQEWFC